MYLKYQILRITATMRTDLHCGRRRLGFVATTELMVPGHAVRYGAAAALARERKPVPEYDDYMQAEQELARLFFSPLFVLQEQEMLYPWVPEHRDTITATRVAARTGTALEFHTRAALDGRLYETEVLSSRDRSGRPLRLRGYCLAAGPLADEAVLADLLGVSRWGGGQAKGFGVPEQPVQVEEVAQENLPSCFGTPCPDGTLRIEADTPCAWPLRYSADMAPAILGRLEPSGGRRWDRDAGPGHRPARAGIVYRPGWQSDSRVRLEPGHRAFSIAKDSATG